MHSSPQSIAIFDNASLGIIIINSTGSIQAINSFALDLFGYRLDEVYEKPVELLIPSRYHHKHVNYRNSFIEQPRNRPMGLGIDLFGIKKNGTEFPVEVSLGNYIANGDESTIAFLSDISVRKKAETEIKKLNDALEPTVEKRTEELTNTMHELELSKEYLSIALHKEKELGELKSRFVSMASHEFRTPLSTILSSAYLIEKYITTEEQPKRDKHLQRIISSVNMLTDILNEFLSLGKIEEGKIQVRPTNFNIKHHTKEIIEEIKNTLRAGQQIIFSHTGNVMVFMDASLLKHIIMNMISNASKFSPEKSTIDIYTKLEHGQLILSVKDYGIGISAEDQKHLMERFFRGSNAGNIQGTGLGLHIISKYAELMNGIVKCTSDIEKGTEFSILFNMKQPDI